MKIISIISGGVKRFVGPFVDEDLALKWATKNVDGRIFPYKVSELEVPAESCQMSRLELQAIWAVLTSTPFEIRDKYWETASVKVKSLLNSVKEEV